MSGLTSAAGLGLVGVDGPAAADPGRRDPEELRALAEEAARELANAPRWRSPAGPPRPSATGSA